jgi:hypothetical protein
MIKATYESSTLKGADRKRSETICRLYGKYSERPQGRPQKCGCLNDTLTDILTDAFKNIPGASARAAVPHLETT